MKRYDSIGKIGHIFETDQQVVTDLVIPSGKEIPEHHVDYTVVVVPRLSFPVMILKRNLRLAVSCACFRMSLIV